jgi:hypothetical protein
MWDGRSDNVCPADASPLVSSNKPDSTISITRGDINQRIDSGVC